jgi:biotin transporter BioY
LGFSLILVIGACALALINRITLARAFVVGILPFLIGDALKTVLAAFVADKLGPFADALIARTKANG